MPVSISGAGSISGLDQGFNVTTGSVGVGTTNPRTDLQVGAFGGGDSNIQLATGTSGASNILFGDGSAGSDYYKGFIKYNHSTDNLELYTTDDIIQYTGGSERLRIESNGRIAIGGFSGATHDLHIKTASSPAIKLEDTTQTTILQLYAQDSNAHVGTHSNHDLILNTNTTERLRITSAGKVGINTDDPKQKLSVVGRVNIDNQGDYYGAWIDGDSQGTSSFNVGAWHNTGGKFRNDGNNVVIETMNESHDIGIQPGANEGKSRVGVGIHGPSVKLHVRDTANAAGVTGTDILRIANLRVNTGAGAANLRFVTNEVSGTNQYTRAQIGAEYDGSSNVNGRLMFATSNTSGNLVERLRIASDGQLTLNDSTGIKLSAKVSTVYTLDGTLSYYATTNGVYLNGAGTNGWLRLNAGGVENNHNAINIFGGAAGAYITMHTSNNERIRIDSSGNANFKQKVSIGELYGGGEILSVGKSSGTSYMAFHNGGANMGFIGFADQLVTGGASNQLGIRSQDAIFFATGGSTERVRLDNDRMTFAQNRRLRFAPNSGWGAGLNMGGNGNSSDTTYGSIALTNGNLHLDPRGGTYGSYLNWYTGSGGTYFGNGSGGQAGRIDSSGNLTLSGTYPGSDLRLKENIESITGATDKIKALVGKTFTWKPESGLDSYKRYGFIAQEVQQVVPDLVKAIGSHYFDANDNLVHNIDPTETDEDRESAGITKSLTVNSEGITPILVEAMKELIAKNEALEARIAVLEGS